MEQSTQHPVDLTPGEWRDRAFTGVTVQTHRFLALVEGLDDEQATTSVPGSQWTVAQTAAHVCSLYRRLTDDPRRSADAGGVAAQNAADIEAIGTDLGAITGEIRERLDVVGAFLPHIDPAREFPFHAGQHVTMTAGLGVLVGELVAHGDDIVRATGASAVAVALDDGLEILWRFTMPVLTGWATDAAGSIDRRWSFDFGWARGPVVLHVDHGQLTVDPAGTAPVAAADHHVLVEDPVTMTLAFPYRRRAVVDPAVQDLAGLFRSV